MRIYELIHRMIASSRTRIPKVQSASSMNGDTCRNFLLSDASRPGGN